MFLVHLSQLKNVQPSAKQPAAAQKAAPTKPKPANKPVFEFYDRLKDEQIKVPKYEKPTEANSASQTHAFYLQVASFRKEEDADKVRAKLILMNMNASIENSKLQSGETRYRVIIGPYTSKSKLAKARDTLVSNGFEYLTLKRPL